MPQTCYLLAMFDKALILPSIISCCREMQMDNLVGDNLLKSQVHYGTLDIIYSYIEIQPGI